MRGISAGARDESISAGRSIGTAALLAAVLIATACATSAHHAPSEYDFKKVVEIEGVLAEVRWQNPHVRIRVRTGVDASGTPIVVDVEGGALSVMRRTNATPAGLRAGDKVRVAGNPSRRGPERMFGLNLLQADGKEMLFQPGLFPRWAKAPLGSETNWFDQRDLEKSTSGMFRVWSSRLNEFLEWDQSPLPLTEAAREKVAAWDRVNDSVTHGCEPVGMPTIMDHPYPIELVRQADTILLRFEIYDAVRTIHMNQSVAPESLPQHVFGRSIGRWEGDTLVVRTDGITWAYFDHLGTPVSPSVSTVERFTVSSDGSKLHYTMVVTDPDTFTRPVQLKRSWFARANETLKPYECRED